MEYAAVAAGPILVTGIILYANANRNYEEVKKNWVAYRCNPMYMPFTSMFSETPASENFKYCIDSFSSEVFARATEPVYQVFGMFADILFKFIEDIQHFLTYLAGMDSFIFSFADTVFGKIFNTMSTFLLQMGHIKDIFSRIASSAYYSVFIIQTLVDFVWSMFNLMMAMIKAVVIMVFALGLILAIFYPVVLAFLLPIGALFGIGFCFDPNTLVQTNRGIIPISSVVLGDDLNGSKVTGLFHVICPPSVDLYWYNGVLVSGRHLVNHRGTWMYVSETGSPKHSGPRPPYLVCLNTSNNLIQIGESTFRDYEEVSDLDSLRKIEKLAFGRYTYSDSAIGLHPKTLVKRRGAFVSVNSLRLGETIDDGKVVGVIRLDASDVEWYDIDGCIMSGSQPVFYDDRIQLAKEVGKQVEIGDMPYSVQIIIDNELGYFNIHNKILVRDYPDSHNGEILERIQEVVLSALRKKVVC